MRVVDQIAKQIGQYRLDMRVPVEVRLGRDDYAAFMNEIEPYLVVHGSSYPGPTQIMGLDVRVLPIRHAVSVIG